MTAMLKIAKLEKGNIYEMFRENIFESDKAYEGYKEVIRDLLELLEDKIEKNVLKAEELEKVKEILENLAKICNSLCRVEKLDFLLVII